MSVVHKYVVAGEGFRFLCDGCERSFQLCRVWIDAKKLPDSVDKRYKIIKTEDGISYGVFDNGIDEIVHRVVVNVL